MDVLVRHQSESTNLIVLSKQEYRRIHQPIHSFNKLEKSPPRVGYLVRAFGHTDNKETHMSCDTDPVKRSVCVTSDSIITVPRPNPPCATNRPC